MLESTAMSPRGSTRERGSTRGQAPKPRPGEAGFALPWWKTGLFCLLVVAAFLGVCEFALALLQVRPIVQEEDPYLGFVAPLPLYVPERQPDGSLRMVTAPNKQRWFNEQSFPMPKPPGTYRIFTLGGSTTFGHPYDDTTSFSGWLRQILRQAAPSRTWEVINAGGVSYASYRVAELMQELVRYEPDLFVVYSGQNEFLERRTYHSIIEANPGIVRLNAWASRTRTYAAMRKAIAAVHPPRTDQARRKFEMTGEVETLLDVAGGLSLYTRDDSLQQQITEHYAFNLHRMVRLAREANAAIVLVTPASNLLDCSPFKSEHVPGLAPADVERFDAAFAAGQRALAAGDVAGALPELQRAVQIDPRFAEAQYRLGRAFALAGRDSDAAAYLQRSLDEDVCPLRQPSALRAALQEVARQEQVPLVDFPAILAESTFVQTGHRILGAHYFLDHVHPTIPGNRVLGVELVRVMAAGGILAPAADWETGAVAAATREIDSRIDHDTIVRGLRNVAMTFNWAGKSEEALRVGELLQEVEPEDDVNLVVRGRRAAAEGRRQDAIALYSQALVHNPGNLEARCDLAIELSRLGKHAQAVAEYQRVLEGWPEQWLVHIDIAYSYLQLGRAPEAIGHYRKVVALRPRDPRALVTLAAAYAQTARRDDALRVGAQAVQLARDTSQEGMAAALETMLAAYAAGQPWDPRMGIRAP